MSDKTVFTEELDPVKAAKKLAAKTDRVVAGRGWHASGSGEPQGPWAQIIHAQGGRTIVVSKR